MAKSIRSKCKRRNRSALRKEICVPAISQRQEKISKSIADGIKEKRGSSIIGLKSLFHQKGGNDEEGGSQPEDDVMDDADEEEEEEAEVKDVKVEVAKKSKRVQDKFKEKKLVNNPKMTKKLVWF